MIEYSFERVLGDSKDSEGWLEILMKIDYKGISTSILLIKLRIKEGEEKEII
jgi:hypothetical protein